MNFTTCSLYGVKDLKELQNLLGFSLYEYRDTSKIYKKFYSVKNQNGRLIEAPNHKLKQIQKKIAKYLSVLDYPDYLFSLKGKSFIQGVATHKNTPSVIIKIDIRKFFPSISRNKIYKFWRYNMNMGGYTAELITNITTIALPIDNPIAAFLKEKKIECLNHLTSGSPASPLLSFLCNHEMFEEINTVVRNHNGLMSIYADDITVSGVNNPKEVLFQIRDIIFKNGYRLSSNKSGIKHNNGALEINGIILKADGELAVPNRVNKKLVDKYTTSKDNSDKASIKGLKLYKYQVKTVNSQRCSPYRFSFLSP